MRVSVDRGRRFVHCVLVRISPVAVRLQYIALVLFAEGLTTLRALATRFLMASYAIRIVPLCPVSGACRNPSVGLRESYVPPFQARWSP
jgi:hypothetical protein